jgi:diguanylate cyclase (GGDEF)-like protein
MQVEIADDLYEKYRQLVNEHYLAADVPSRLQQLIESDLRSRGVGYEKDPLTGCKTRGQIFEDIRRATTEGQQPFYRGDFACIDIEDFRTYLDNTGLVAGDEVLKGIGKQLREAYSEANVYRFGGDEFVIELGDRTYSPPQTPAGISLKHSLVKVVAKKNQRRNHYVNRVIVFHLDKGIIEATQTGTEIACEIVTS